MAAGQREKENGLWMIRVGRVDGGGGVVSIAMTTSHSNRASLDQDTACQSRIQEPWSLSQRCQSLILQNSLMMHQCITKWSLYYHLGCPAGQAGWLSTNSCALRIGPGSVIELSKLWNLFQFGLESVPAEWIPFHSFSRLSQLPKAWSSEDVWFNHGQVADRARQSACPFSGRITALPQHLYLALETAVPTQIGFESKQHHLKTPQQSIGTALESLTSKGWQLFLQLLLLPSFFP